MPDPAAARQEKMAGKEEKQKKTVYLQNKEGVLS